MLRSIVPVLALACNSDFNVQDEAEPAPIPAERPVEVVTQVDFVAQSSSPETDVLFVIDDSCSMQNNQAQLAQNFPTFMDFFEGSGLDYHIGVVSMDVALGSEAGVLKESPTFGLRYITPEVDNARDAFEEMSVLGSEGDPIERGLQAAYTMLELKRDETPNLGFYRPEAALHTIFVSDEEDSSLATVIPIQEWIRWYDRLKLETSQRSASSIVCFPGCDDIVPGTRYLDVTETIGGVRWNIVDQDWKEVLERLGIQTSGLRKEYFFSQFPVVDSIEVSVISADGSVVTVLEPAVFDDSVSPPELVSGDWTYSRVRNSVKFVEFIPDPLDVVKLSYTLLASTQTPRDESPTPKPAQ